MIAELLFSSFAKPTYAPKLALLAEQMQILICQQADHDTRLTEQDVRLTEMESIIEEVLQHIPVTPAQAEYLASQINGLAKRIEKATGKAQYALLMNEFKHQLHTPRYDALPAASYEAAIQWIADKTRQYFPNEDTPPMQERLV